MYSLVNMDFSDWLLEEMNKRGWSQADLSRSSGVDRQVISNYINRRRTNPEPEALISIAHGFGISPITVFRKAGLLPEGSDDATFSDWKFLLDQLPQDEQDELRQIALMKIEKRKKESGAKSLKPKKAG
jgi:transcriptional regulator with XRE-family HTH domain